MDPLFTISICFHVSYHIPCFVQLNNSRYLDPDESSPIFLPVLGLYTASLAFLLPILQRLSWFLTTHSAIPYQKSLGLSMYRGVGKAHYGSFGG